MFGAPFLKSTIQSLPPCFEAVQLTLSRPPGATTFVLGVTTYTPIGVTGVGGVTAAGVGPAGELAAQPRVIPRSDARMPGASIDRTIPFRGVFNIDVPSLSLEAKSSRENVNRVKKT